MTRTSRNRFLESLAGAGPLAGSDYAIDSVDLQAVIFRATMRTGVLMLPTELVLEWLMGYDRKIISVEMNAREMRTRIVEGTIWAKQLHSFETHLRAVVLVYAQENRR